MQKFNKQQDLEKHGIINKHIRNITEVTVDTHYTLDLKWGFKFSDNLNEEHKKCHFYI